MHTHTTVQIQNQTSVTNNTKAEYMVTDIETLALSLKLS